MPNFHHTTRALPFLADFPARDRQLAERAFRQQEERRRKADESRAQKADEMVESLRRELSDLLGARKLGELRDAMKRERLAFRNLWQPPVDLDRDYRRENRARKRRVDALLRRLEVTPEQLREIGTRSEQALRRHFPPPKARWRRATASRTISTDGRACRRCMRCRCPGERLPRSMIRRTRTAGFCSGHRSSASCSVSPRKPAITFGSTDCSSWMRPPAW